MSLGIQLDKFWSWAEVTPAQYASGLMPSKNLPVEWETYYPDWIRLEKSFWKELEQYKRDSDSERLTSILEFVGIDNESGNALDELIKLYRTQRDFVRLAYKFYMPQTRWQIAEFLRESDISNKISLLEEMISFDEDKYVQRIALLALADVSAERACEHAYKKLIDDDEYLRLVSLRILKECNSKYLFEAVKILKDDASKLIQEELFGIN